MHQFKLCRGIRFTTNDGRLLTLERRTVTNLYQMIDEQGAVESVTRVALLERWRNHEWALDPTSLPDHTDLIFHVTPRDLASYTPEQQALAQQRFKLIEPFISLDRVTNTDIANHVERIEREGCVRASLRTVRRWLCRYRYARDMTCLIPTEPRRRPRMRQEFEGILEASINETFLTPERPSRQTVVDEIVKRIEAHNGSVEEAQRIVVPSRATLYRRLRDVCALTVDTKRFGSDEARRKHRQAVTIIKTSQILERVELDHMRVDLIIIDAATNLVLGRPWLTIAIDHHSRMVVGFHLSFDSPNAYSVLHTLVNAALPKEELLKRFPDIKNPWPAMGLPVTIVVDNGLELHGSRIKEFCVETSSSLQFCPRVTPWFKPVVERFNRSLNTGLIHTLPGTTFSNPTERGKYESEKRACIDFATFEHMLVRWIVDEYNVRPHRSIKTTPLEAWNRSFNRHGVSLPASPSDLQLLLGASKTRRLQHYGIELDKVQYNSPELQDLSRRLCSYSGKHRQYHMVTLRYYDTIDCIDVFDPENKTYLRVPARDLEYAAGLTRATHRLLTATTKQQFGDYWRGTDRLEVKQKHQQQVLEAQRRKRSNKRHARAVENVGRCNRKPPTTQKFIQSELFTIDLTKPVGAESFATFEPIVSPHLITQSTTENRHAH